MTLVATGTLEMDNNIQCLCKIIHGESLRQFGLLSADVKNIEALDMDYYIKVLALYILSCEFAFKQKKAQCAAERKKA